MPKFEPTSILDISTLSDAQHILAHETLVHQTDEVQINVYILGPGGRIPAHRQPVSSKRKNLQKMQRRCIFKSESPQPIAPTATEGPSDATDKFF